MLPHIFLVLTVLFKLCTSARILAVFPVPSISHQVVFRPITQELARRGHEVIVITTDPVFLKDEALKTLKEIDVHDMSYEMWTAAFHASTSNEYNDPVDQIRVAFTLQRDIFEAQLKTKEVSELLRKPRDYFDLIIVEALSKPSYILTHIFKVPGVMVSSFGASFSQFDAFGVPEHPILYPDPLTQKLNDLRMWDKVSEVCQVNKLHKIVTDLVNIESLRKITGHSDIPAFSELIYNFDMFFLNVYPMWDSNRPVPPNIIYMGGLHQNPQKELPKDLKKYLDESKNGLIYISFGTNVSPSLFPPTKIKMIINTLSRLPYNVLWKYDKDVLPGQTSNIKIGKWFPQSDLLRHPNVKLFITQGGLQSTDEAVTAGVPVLGMPMLGDQWYNVEQYERFKIGKRLDLDKLTEENLKTSIESIIGDKSYRDNIKDIRDKRQDQPMSSLDRTVWWMEYVIRHKGAKHLCSAAAGVSWVEYYEVPLVLTLLSIVLTIAISAAFVIAFVYRLLCSKNSKVKKS